jgi:hypothetical protein
MVPQSDKRVTCIEANNIISSFSPIDHMLQVNFQEGEPYLLQCASIDVLDLCSNRFGRALLSNSNNDANPRTICIQEGEKGIECLHIKFTLAEDIFESRMTQKQGENAEYMFELRTTQMQEKENDEDITNMYTPTVVAYDSKVKVFLASLYLIHVMNGSWTMIYVQCHLQKYLHGSKKAWIMHGKDGL